MGNYEDTKEVEIKNRKFVIRKFDARTGSFMLIKVTGLIAPMLKGLDLNNLQTKEGEEVNLKDIDIAGVVSGLTSLTEPDFNYIHDKCLQVCFETLPSGATRVLNPDGNFGVIGLETDSATTLALVAHTLIFNVTSFFSGSPLGSVLGGLFGSKLSTAKM
ncbi:hypothetical protein E4K67_22420 [Desulfosporosinus fructosivorans]|uniref:Uncharacterized protein n=1 Tax=Desulfosporosinus fructosivorans TaxID=2018669 RepID=A0A4Z0QZJ1_9FIRM|nr:hypothetical protein [Desulfosporosinus fructosivorans]TGE35874.1 hypothetical protein E4K67_22420 [Desulfosporosinus fructosivorans]